MVSYNEKAANSRPVTALIDTITIDLNAGQSTKNVIDLFLQVTRL